MFANKTHEKGHDLMLIGKNEEAILFFERALIETPDHPDIYSDRGVAYLHLKNKVECLKDLNTALRLQPEYSYRYSSRAYAKDFFGDTESAIEDYEKAIELDPDDAVAHNNLGLLQEKLGYQLKAKQNFERADKLSKQEKKLFDLIDEMEQIDEVENSTGFKPEEQTSMEELPLEISHQMIDPQVSREKNISTFQEFRKIFTSKVQFKDFMRFLKNGFRIK